MPSELHEKTAADTVSDAGSNAVYRISGRVLNIIVVLGAIGLALAINQVFLLNLFGFQPMGNSYLYYLIGIFLSIAFLSISPVDRQICVAWYDWLFVAATLISTGYLGLHGLEIIQQGWEFQAPLAADIASGVIMLLVLEAVRRAGGTVLLGTALLFGTYPLYADYMPGFLWGTSFTLDETVRAHVLGVESIIGIPMQVVAELVIGFVAFGCVLTVTGGATFFMELASALLGRTRGGPAKVAVAGSGILGSLSGSVISNILTSGPFSIPIMRKVGYPAYYAAAIESCASTGATLMPPVMGTVAFIMASFLGVQYAEVITAAFIPAILFYVALLLQVDMFAARKNLKGLKREEIPAVWATLRSGWPYLLSLAVLIYIIMVLRLESYAPYIASLVMIVATLFIPEHRLTFGRLKILILEIARSVAALVAILTGIGLVVGGLSYTGVAGAFSRELLLYAGGSVPLMLIAGAITSFVLGMGMTVSACYIFLSILLAPALVNAGLNPLASHLFILYWGMLSYITPPVALASITAANIAGSDPIKTGMYSLRLGGTLFILPFIFVYDPALVMNGSAAEVLSSVFMAVVAIWALTSALEGYLYWAGPLPLTLRAVLGLAGVLIMLPEFYSGVVGTVLLAAAYGIGIFMRRGLPAGPSIRPASPDKR